MRNLQMGIMFSIARSSKEASDGLYAGPAKEDDFLQQVPALTRAFSSSNLQYFILTSKIYLCTANCMHDEVPDSIAQVLFRDADTLGCFCYAEQRCQ